MSRLRKVKENEKIAEVGNSTGIYISNEDLIKFIKTKGSEYEQYLDTTKYESDITSLQRGFSKGIGFFTKQKLLKDTTIERPMIFYAEAHLFLRIGTNDYTYMVFFFQEKTLDHKTFDLSEPVHIEKNKGYLSNARNYISHAYLGEHWVTEGIFEDLDEAINSLGQDWNNFLNE